MTVEHRWVGAPTPPTSGPDREYKSDPAWDKLLLVAGAIVVVVALLVVPGILNRGGKNPVAAAAEATSNSPGVRISYSGQAGGPESMGFTGTGVMNGETDRALIRMRGTGSSASGVQSFTLEEILDDGDLYMHSPELGGAFGGSARWMLMRSEVFGDILRSDATGSALAGSPSQQLDALKDASYHVTEVGPEQVNGVVATHYSALIDVGKLTDQLKGEISDELADLVDRAMQDVSSARVDVWVDDKGLIRRESQSSSMGSLGTFTMTMNFTDYGIHPNIQVPPPNQVYDLTPFMQKALDELSG